MGMYDTLSIDNKWIPEHLKVDYENQDYQTKDLECLLNHYDILDDGKLVLTSERHQEGEVFKFQNGYTGQIRFYDDNADFIAWCVKGVVKEVVCVAESATP